MFQKIFTRKITFDTTMVMNHKQGRWLLIYKKGSNLRYNNVVSRTICMNLIESFFYDCNSMQLTNQLPILATATCNRIDVLSFKSINQNNHDKWKKDTAEIPSNRKIKKGKMRKRVTQSKVVWCRHKSDNMS